MLKVVIDLRNIRNTFKMWMKTIKNNSIDKLIVLCVSTRTWHRSGEIKKSIKIGITYTSLKLHIHIVRYWTEIMSCIPRKKSVKACLLYTTQNKETKTTYTVLKGTPSPTSHLANSIDHAHFLLYRQLFQHNCYGTK